MQRQGKWFVVLVGFFVLFNLLTASASATLVRTDTHEQALASRIDPPLDEPQVMRLPASDADVWKSEEPLVYVRVLKGDSAWSITRKCDRPGTDYDTLLAYNPQLPPAVDRGKDMYVHIHKDQILALPLGWRVNPAHLNAIAYLDAPDSAPKPTTQKTDSNLAFWSLVVALACGALAAWLIYRYIARREREHEADPGNHPAVVDGGLHSSAAIAADQIADHYAGREGRISRCERGIIINRSCPGLLPVSMYFGDGRTRTVNLENGSHAYRVTLNDGSVEYYRSHCGNLIGPEVRSGQFILPAGWEFVPATDTAARADFPPTTTAPPASGKPEQPPAEPAKRQGCCTGASVNRMEGAIKVTVTVGETPPRTIEVSGVKPHKIFFGSGGHVDVFFEKQ